MRKTVIALIMVAAAAVMSDPAAAAKRPPVAASITLNQATPAYGDAVTFTTTIPRLTGSAFPMVDLWCFQDVDGNGIVDTTHNPDNPDMVQADLDHPDAVFPLGNAMSIWSLRGGGPALCTANLESLSWNANTEQVGILATTGVFPVTG